MYELHHGCNNKITTFPAGISLTRKLKPQRRRRQQERQKSKGFRLAKQQLCTCVTHFCTFLCRRCTSTTWKHLNSRFVEDGTQDNNFLFIFLNFVSVPWNSTPKSDLCQHLTNWTRQNKRDEVWTGANSLFKWRFRSSRCRRIRTESKSSIFFCFEENLWLM